ncbi:MAG TPA: protein phosphatase 2C domain-containing protein [Bryobacteraceae bacterium]|jgi:PPM family protein phosphatase|nr:protein phosphatase 2C domain-containing protein [Bryobacteraceae bacterium]
MIDSYGLCDVGLVRKQNQDRILIDDSVGLFVVADGMGGHVHGEIAAQEALTAIQFYIDSSSDRFDVSWPFGYSFDLSIDANRIATGIQLANRRVRLQAQQNPDTAGMGTTVAAVLVNDSHAVVANVGDSRIYLFRGGELQQLSIDDTWIESMTTQGLMNSTEAQNHPMRNVLTQAAGSKDMVEVHVHERRLESKDTFLLSSDGLHGVIGNEGILSILRQGLDLQRCAERLVEAAKANGAPDNVSVVLLSYNL